MIMIEECYKIISVYKTNCIISLKYAVFTGNIWIHSEIVVQTAHEIKTAINRAT